jgi:hypothetical protein
MTEWVTHTPDGLRLHISRKRDRWLVRCEDGDEVRSEVLDVALIEAIRGNQVVAHSTQRVDGAWVRTRADQIERELRSMGEQVGARVAPPAPRDQGDRPAHLPD